LLTFIGAYVSREHYRIRCWNLRCLKWSWHQVVVVVVAAAVADDDDDVDDDARQSSSTYRWLVLPKPRLRSDSRQKAGVPADLSLTKHQRQ